MPADISKRTVAILLIVAIILSVTSTLLAVNAANKAKEEVIVNEDIASAQVSLIVSPPPADKEGAQVSLNVVEGGAK